MSEQVCVVTGSTGNDGTGSATVKLFAKRGWRVVVHYSKNAAAADKVAAECRALGAKDVLSIQADVTSDPDCRRFAKAVGDAWGRCDLLVNNAATTRFVPHRKLEGLSTEDWRNVLDTNVTGVFHVTRAFEPLLRKTAGASVVNISSMAGTRGTGSCMAYGASKAALNAMTMSFARVLAPEVRVNAILPGFITGDWLRNGMGTERYEAFRKQYAAGAPLGKVCEPADIAAAVEWLGAGPGVLTGQLVELDGGNRLGRG